MIKPAPVQRLVLVQVLDMWFSKNNRIFMWVMFWRIFDLVTVSSPWSCIYWKCALIRWHHQALLDHLLQGEVIINMQNAQRCQVHTYAMIWVEKISKDNWRIRSLLLYRQKIAASVQRQAGRQTDNRERSSGRLSHADAAGNRHRWFISKWYSSTRCCLIRHDCRVSPLGNWREITAVADGPTISR